MTLSYASGEAIKVGDRIRYHGEAGEVELVVEAPTGDASADWYFHELGAGVMVHEPKVFGRVYVQEIADGLLEFVARATQPHE